MFDFVCIACVCICFIFSLLYPILSLSHTLTLIIHSHSHPHYPTLSLTHSHFIEPKSKRLSTRHRAKIDRKAREMHRRQRKDSKTAKNTNVSKRRKDPGVPAMIPMRAQLIEKMREERAKELAQKAARRAMHNNINAMQVEEEEEEEQEESLESLAQSALEANATFQGEEEEGPCEFSEASSNIDSSRRAFYREFKLVVESADVILMVLDARDPQGCRVKEVEEAILATGGKKRLVMVLNKIDLVPRDNVQGWIKVIQREFPCVAFKSSTQESRSNLSQSAVSTSGSEAFGADGLLQLLKNYARSGNLNKKLRVRVGVVGYPNVGKSSLINSLKRSRVCNVGATPGVTTARQEIHLDSTVSLIDCPGIVFNHRVGEAGNESLMLRNCLKVEQLEDPITPALQALTRIDPIVLQRIYTLTTSDITLDNNNTNYANQLLVVIARRLGKLKRGGVPDLEAAAKHILNDWNNGKISYFTPVPTEKPHLMSQAEQVNEFAPRFSFNDNEEQEEEEASEESNDNMQIETSHDSSVADAFNAVKQSSNKMIEAATTTTEATTSDTEDLLNSYDSEDEVNHQINQSNARSLKKDQKKLAKQARRSMQE